MTQIDLNQLHIDKSRHNVRSSARNRYGLFMFLLILAAIAGFLYHKGVLSPAVSIQTVSVQKIYPYQTVTILNASGYVVAQRKASVASKITGRLVYLAVEEGNRVKQGDVIARLESEDALAAKDQAQAEVKAAQYRLDQAAAELENATLMYHRNKKLAADGYIAQSDFDSADARFKQARAGVDAFKAALRSGQAALRSAEVMLDYSCLRAPFDAVVLTKNADIGDIVTPLGAAANAKASVVDLADMKSLQVEVDVSESNIENVRQGQPCEISLDALPSERFPGKVHIIIPTADRTKASIMVKVAFDELNSRILPEMSAKVAFLSREVTDEEKNPVTVLPASAIVLSNGQAVVYKVSGDRIAITPVRLGKRMNELSEILSGLNTGDRVAAVPSAGLTEGTRIKSNQ